MKVMVRHKKEIWIHAVLSFIALLLSVFVASQGKTFAAIPATFAFGWSGAHVWMLVVRGMSDSTQ